MEVFGELRCPACVGMQVLHNLSLWTANRKSLSEQVAKTDASRAKKEIKLVSRRGGEGNVDML